ncbi:hypothetical protein BJ875DRAFT_260129 [Amylocarpus encephaloides]|uniref:MARVEL domain-containing protein n=1 Tax=Amylocarpus encephaloides TaxID=45428 RepID=A0A9P8BZI9_9HELO|nr:hypothetical protein BJ875DRAFT_260129 [Amylocarpus encephaloides]
MIVKRNVRGGQPSPYPRWPFHGLRAAQLISSITVSGIMCYFMYYLRAERFTIPWTFIVLLSVSLATIVSLTVTIILYNFTFLSPRYNLITNGGISAIWAMGFGMLSWSISTSNVLAKACTGSIWGGDAGAAVCRDYKALWSMTLVGTVATFSALTLDFSTWKKTASRGAYAMPEDDKDAIKANNMTAAELQNQKFEPLKERSVVQTTGVTPFHNEQDIGYHSGYGQESWGPLENKKGGT